ncbi:MAG: hypothetical protein MJA29_08740 [Candidatus Omnitrophica bacterium]|nr:hypothetical protein [Candidatus Omnitrophota bacterium]
MEDCTWEKVVVVDEHLGPWVSPSDADPTAATMRRGPPFPLSSGGRGEPT